MVIVFLRWFFVLIVVGFRGGRGFMGWGRVLRLIGVGGRILRRSGLIRCFLLRLVGGACLISIAGRVFFQVIGKAFEDLIVIVFVVFIGRRLCYYCELVICRVSSLVFFGKVEFVFIIVSGVCF